MPTLCNHTPRFLALLLVPLAALSCARPPPPPPGPVAVHVVHPQRADTSSTFVVSGDVRARVESNLSFRVGGKVTSRLVDIGDHVQAGALLARLDPEQPRADVAVAAAGLASTRATGEFLRADLSRQRYLFAQAAIARSALDDTERDASLVTSALLAAEARLGLAREVLSYTELRAAHAGIVTARALEVGQVAQPGVTAFRLADDGPRDAVFRVDENVASRLEMGTPFAVVMVDDPRVRVEGRVRELSPTVEPGTGTVRIKVALEGSLPPPMTLGLPVVGSLTLASMRAFTLPSASIVSDDHEEPSVWVIDPGTHAVSLRRVVVQAYDSGSVTVRDGIADGDVVVTDGSCRLRPSQVVQITGGERS